MKKPLILSLLFLLVFHFFSCKKQTDVKEPEKTPDFSYATTKDLTIKLKFLSADNKPLKYVLVNFYYPDGKNTTDPVFKALTDSNGVVQGSYAAPAYKTALLVDLKYPGISRNMTIFFDDNALNGTIKASPVTSGSISSKGARISGVDSDGDYVEDIYDEFPNDVQRAYTKYYPSKDTWGTLVFEDNWPNKGDYDMNDLVVNYNYAIICDYRGYYKEMSCNYKVPAAGASFTNGFGVTLPYTGIFTSGLTPIQSVTGQKLTDNYIKLGPLGFDENGRNIIPFDNHRSLFNGASGPINVVKDSPKLVAEPVTVKVNFRYPVDNTRYSGYIPQGRVGFYLWDVPFNPFIICNQKMQYEVHQAGYGPSSTAKDAKIYNLYNTGDDAGANQSFSEYPSGLFRSKDGDKPWVLNFAESFDYPTEHSPLNKAYLHFDEWRAGLGYADWYLAKPGYRDDSLIYK